MYKIGIIALVITLGGVASVRGLSVKAEPTLPECSAALFKAKDMGRAMSIGVLGYAQWSASAPDQRPALEAQFKAERAAAMERDTSDILNDCRLLADRIAKPAA